MESNRFEIIEEPVSPFQIARSFTEGLEAIKENSSTAEEFEIKQAQYSIEYMLKKSPMQLLAENPLSEGVRHFFKSGMDLVSRPIPVNLLNSFPTEYIRKMQMVLLLDIRTRNYTKEVIIKITSKHLIK